MPLPFPSGTRPARLDDADAILAAAVGSLERGEIEGVSRHFLEESVRWGIAACRERGAVDVYLSVEGENRGALRLYESLGLRQDVEWPHWTTPVG